MNGDEKKDKMIPEDLMIDFPKELNPELYETSIDWEAEERALEEEERRKKAEARRQKIEIESPARKWLVRK